MCQSASAFSQTVCSAIPTHIGRFHLPTGEHRSAERLFFIETCWFRIFLRVPGCFHDVVSRPSIPWGFLSGRCSPLYIYLCSWLVASPSVCCSEKLWHGPIQQPVESHTARVDRYRFSLDSQRPYCRKERKKLSGGPLSDTLLQKLPLNFWAGFCGWVAHTSNVFGGVLCP